MFKQSLLVTFAAILVTTAFAAPREVKRQAYFSKIHKASEMLDVSQLSSMGSYEGIRSDTGGRATLITKKLTITAPGVFDLMTWIESASSKEAKKVGVFPGYHTTLKLTLEEYAQLFGSTGDVNMSLPVREAVGFVYDITAKSQGNKRIVNCQIATEHLNKREETGHIQFVLEGGLFKSFTVKKRAKIPFTIFFRQVLDAENKALQRESAGLVLKGAGAVGNITDLKKMRSALADPSSENFWSLVK